MAHGQYGGAGQQGSRGGGKKRGPEEPLDHGLGRSQGGFSSKIHLVCEDRWEPTRGKMRFDRLVAKLKEMRRIATRYDKLNIMYENFICLGCIVIYLRTLSKQSKQRLSGRA